MGLDATKWLVSLVLKLAGGTGISDDGNEPVLGIAQRVPSAPFVGNRPHDLATPHLPHYSLRQSRRRNCSNV
jgi:hypothetical protein